MAKLNKVKNKNKKKNKTPFKHEFDSSHFFNREMSWLAFNKRVLNEALDERTPLLERMRFLSIYASNLDEFYMKRVGGLKRQIESEYNYTSVDGLTSLAQLTMVREHLLLEIEKQEQAFIDIKQKLEAENIHIVNWKDLTLEELEFCNTHFTNKIFPILTPLSVDPGKPFPFISNLSYSLGVYLEHPIEAERIFSRVKVPKMIHRLLKLPSTLGASSVRFISTAEIIENNLSHLYRGMKILHIMPFRVTRNADWEHDDDDTEDLLELIEEAINERRLQEPIRIEVLKNHHPEMLKYLIDELGLTVNDVYYYNQQLEYSYLGDLADLEIAKLRYPNWRPITPSIFQRGSVFEIIREKDRLIHQPYDNFSATVEKFITQAAEDPNVMSIKMTLYRTGDNSPFIKALIRAAENGKQVVCLIELKARFDEKRNIEWAKKMEQAGVHVVYGIVGLKTHTKLALVVREEADGELLSYVHIGTGNYNVKTAKLYTDYGLLTTDRRLSTEVSEVFNYLTGSSLKMDYNYLLVAPVNAKSSFLTKIREQEKRAKEGKKVRIVAKMNAMEDVTIAEALYKASMAGVEITLIVRGFCCLKPGVLGLSENIKVISIIGRFLEHSRIYFFSDGESAWSGDYYIGSADWMHRNMHARVEVITPIFHPELQKSLATFMQVMISDERSAWDLQPNGEYTQRQGSNESASHQVMMNKALEDFKATDL
jgi:polyphosphate kinase